MYYFKWLTNNAGSLGFSWKNKSDGIFNRSRNKWKKERSGEVD
jgi:hypothetical protein